MLIGGFLAVGCSSGAVPLPRTANIQILSEPTVPARPRNVLYRDELADAVSEGLAYFLQRVSLTTLTRRDDAGVEQFVGRRLDAMRPATAWFAFDFAPGDIVTHINGVSVGHYNDVLPLFESLPKAEHLDVQIIRGTENKTIRVRIEAKPVASQ
jgi:type II secretory pathway component PulC